MSEDERAVEICVGVLRPDIERPVRFPFEVEFFTTSGTAGIQA